MPAFRRIPCVLIRLAPAARMVMAEWHQSAVGLSAPLIGLDLAKGPVLILLKFRQKTAQRRIWRPPGFCLLGKLEWPGFRFRSAARWRVLKRV